MSSRDTWAVGPSGSIPPPPSRPDLPASGANPASAWSQPLTTRPAPAYGSFATAESWRRVGAVLGVFWAFWFFLTIPGWFALGHYKKWKRGEIATPNGLIFWGLGFSALMVLVILVSLTSGS